VNILGQIRTVVVIAFTWAGSHTFLFYLKTDVTSVFVTSKIDLHYTDTIDSVKRKLLHDTANFNPLKPRERERDRKDI
jgi:hypothetical protein